MFRSSVFVIVLLGLGLVQCFQFASTRKFTPILIRMLNTFEAPLFVDVFGRLGQIERDVKQLKGNVSELKNDVKEIKKGQSISNWIFIFSQIPVWILLVRKM